MSSRVRPSKTAQARWMRGGGFGPVIVATAIAGLAIWAGRGGVGGLATVTPAPTDGSVSQSTQVPTSTVAPTQVAAATNAVVVAHNVVERPGVPSDLHDDYWSVAGQVGLLGTTARLTLPSNEVALAAGGGYVASTELDADSGQHVVTSEGAPVIIRDFTSGATIRTFSSNVYVAEALIVGSRLLWVGPTLPLDAEPRIDGGILSLDLSDPASSPQSVVAASDLSETYGEGAIRGLLRITDRGHALTTQIVSPTRLATEIVDLDTFKVRGVIEHGFMYAFQVVGDRALLVLPHEFTTPESPGRIELFDLSSGKTIGESITADLLAGSLATGEKNVLLQRGVGSDSYITIVDLQDAQVRDLRIVRDGTETLRFMPSLSSATHIALVPAKGSPLDDAGQVRLPVSLLDPQTGALQSPAFTIGEP